MKAPSTKHQAPENTQATISSASVTQVVNLLYRRLAVGLSVIWCLAIGDLVLGAWLLVL